MHVKYEAANLYFNIPLVSHHPYKLSKFNQRLSIIYCMCLAGELDRLQSERGRE